MKRPLREKPAILELSRLLPGVKSTKEGKPPSRRRSVIFVLLALVATLLLGAVGGATLAQLYFDKAPEANSAEAGFAQDMIVHHAQAVEMADIVRDRTKDARVRNLAAEITLSQQAQIGELQGWLTTWDLPIASEKPAMGWMGHPTEGRMPGMATPQQVEQLSQEPPEEADKLFLKLMIPHHQAAIPMSEAVLERTGRPEVRQLAQAISASQQEEINTMQDTLRSMGDAPVELTTPQQAESEQHASHSQASVEPQELAAGITHGLTQWAVVFLAGLVSFVALIWLPTSLLLEDAGQEKIVKEKVVGSFCRWAWILVGLLVLAGLVELPLYALRASGETLSLRLLTQALLETRVGELWIMRLLLSIMTATAAACAAKLQHRAYWLGAVAVAGLLLVTLTEQSHAAAEGGFLPFAADWLHLVAASLWMGGLLAFPILLLVGPVRTMQKEAKAKLLGRTVRRFSKAATIAVMTLILTGLYAALLHVPSLSALIDTPYGQALSMKLGLLVFLLALGAKNLRLRGGEGFGRFVSAELVLAIGIFVATGFLTSLPPADATQQQGAENQQASLADEVVVSQPPAP